MEDNNKVSITCPVCDNAFDMDKAGVSIGDIVECPVCGGTLEVVSADPLTVEPIVKGK